MLKVLKMNEKENKKALTTGKKLLWFFIINCTGVEIFTGWITYLSIKLAQTTLIAPNFTPLNTLIGAVIAQSLGVIGYFVKSTLQNRKGGITYDAAAARNFIKKEQTV